MSVFALSGVNDRTMFDYSIERYTATLSVADFIAEFRDADRVGELCRACDNYGKSWCCPPFDFDVEQRLRNYDTVDIFATRIIPTKRDIPISELPKLIYDERIQSEQKLLELERRFGGVSCAFVGECLHCKGESCARLCARPCRYPQLMRHSLEAYGFDVAKTIKSLFEIELKWSKEGMIPEYIVLVSALFYNNM